MCHNSLNRELLEKGIYLRQQEDHKREMYALFLTLHSIFRWLVLATLLYALYRSYRGWFGQQNIYIV